jgi:hypothetical protein
MQCGPRFIKIILEPLPNGLTSFKLSEHTTFSQGQSHILHKFFLVEMVTTIIVFFQSGGHKENGNSPDLYQRQIDCQLDCMIHLGTNSSK